MPAHSQGNHHIKKPSNRRARSESQGPLLLFVFARLQDTLPITRQYSGREICQHGAPTQCSRNTSHQYSICFCLFSFFYSQIPFRSSGNLPIEKRSNHKTSANIRELLQSINDAITGCLPKLLEIPSSGDDVIIGYRPNLKRPEPFTKHLPNH